MQRLETSLESLEFCVTVLRPALLLAPRTYLSDIHQRLAEEGIQQAVAVHDTAFLYKWIVRLLDRQGVSNAAAISFAAQNGSARWQDVDVAIATRPICPKLKSYWHFEKCNYRKNARTCGCPDLMSRCVLPKVPARKGALNQVAFSLWLFVRDVCGGDIVTWIDGRLASADAGPKAPNRAVSMQAAVLDPFVNIAGTGPKTWSMILAELLLAADLGRERWVTTGASFVAVDSLVHAYLHRTGILRQLDAEHAYGPACHGHRGCSGVIAVLAAKIDARQFNQDFPTVFPRWVQFAIWWFCAADGWSICNANKIDDRAQCEQAFCPAFRYCDKIAIKP